MGSNPAIPTNSFSIRARFSRFSGFSGADCNGPLAGVPAYLFAGYVGASRLASNRHHVSDVVLGAGLGLIAARVVTVPIGSADFNLNVAPVPGGAAIAFSSK